MNIINVSAVGFSAQDQEKLKKIFQHSQNRSKTYAWMDCSSESVDILMVATDDLSALNAQKKLQQDQPELCVVTVSRNIPAQPGAYHIKPPLLSVRVLRALDKIDIQQTAKMHAHGQSNTAQPVVPLMPVPSTAQQERYASTPVGTEISSSEYQVLVIDDSSTMQKALQIELLRSSLSVAVDCVDSGEAALQQVEKKHYDFIFLDIMMPGIDGYATCQKMRLRPEMKKTPIIMLSGKTSPLDEVKGIMAGSTTYLTKPIQPDEFQKLLLRVGGWLGKFSNRASETVAG